MTTGFCGKSQPTLDDLVGSAQLVYIGKATCPFCVKAKNAFQAVGVDFNSPKVGIYDIVTEKREDAIDDVGKLQDEIMARHGSRSVPKVFIEGKLIGGGDETAAAHQSGELKKMLKEAGVI